MWLQRKSPHVILSMTRLRRADLRSEETGKGLMNKSAPLAISLIGQFSIRDPDGEDLTPRSQKACALLALLCEAPDLRCTRVSLQDKLWSDREQAQGATSLRQALSEIRRSLGDHRKVLRSDMRMVSLDPQAVDIDIADPAKLGALLAKGLTYLDGIGVRDPEFEDWLRDRRLALEDVAQPPSPSRIVSQTQPVLITPPQQRNLPVLHLSLLSDGQPGMFAEHVLHAVGKGVSEAGAVDMRFGFEGQTPGPFYVLEIGERSLGDGTALHIRLRAMPGQVLCWQKSEMLPISDIAKAGASLSRLINQCIDGTIAAFGGRRPFGQIQSNDPSVAKTASVLHRMWSSIGRDPDQLISELEESFDHYGRGIDLAWQAFVWCFVVGERRNSPRTKSDASRLIRQALELEPDNALVLALGSHVYGFVLHQYEVALSLAERSVRLDRNNCLGWTFLGIARANLGQPEKGYEATAHARRIAGEGPYRDFIDGVCAMASCLTARFDDAILLAETISVRRPTFAAPLRYLITSYLLKDDQARAEMTILRLKEIEPDFEMRLLSEPEYPMEPLRRSGLIDLRSLPMMA